MDGRLDQLCCWLNDCFELSPEQALKHTDMSVVCGDASFRRYFRFQYPCPQDEPAAVRSWIAVDAPPEKERGTAAFVDVAARLERAGLCAPHVHQVSLQQGFMLLDDLGEQSYRALIQSTDDAEQLSTLLPLLPVLAQQVFVDGLPVYSEPMLQDEMDEFWQWYLHHHIDAPFIPEEQQLWQQLCDQILTVLAEQPQVFVHRDFMSSNLIATPHGVPGIIDFQDAVIGPLTYDFASLIWDRYISWSRPQLEVWMEQARQQMAPEISPQLWQRWCDWTGLQRNLKIVGRFARLKYRDGKDGYIELLPRFIEFVRDILNRYEELVPYRPMLEARLCGR